MTWWHYIETVSILFRPRDSLTTVLSISDEHIATQTKFLTGMTVAERIQYFERIAKSKTARTASKANDPKLSSSQVSGNLFLRTLIFEKKSF